MKIQLKKNRYIIVIIFAMSIIPFLIAWYLSNHADWMGNGTNQGELIIPPVTTEKSEFIPFDSFSRNNIQELSGHWVLVNVIPKMDCLAVCLQALYKTKQLRLMMNKDLTRIRRLVLIIPEINTELAQHWWKEDARLLKSKPAKSLLQKIKKIRNAMIPDGMLFLMDPLGNLMMQYEPAFNPYSVKKDLQKLLRISQIG